MRLLRQREEDAQSYRVLEQDRERSKRDLESKLVRMNAAEERRRMEDEERKSMMREERESEQRRMMEVEHSALVSEQEERRIDSMRRKAAEDDKIMLADPSMLSVLVLFGGDSKQEMYRFHFPVCESPTIETLKFTICRDFGYTPNQQRMYYKYQPVCVFFFFFVYGDSFRAL